MAIFLAEDFRSIVDKLNNYMLSSIEVNEGDDTSDSDKSDVEPIKFRNIERVLKTIAEVSPTAKLHVIKLTTCITAGIKDKQSDGGMSSVISSIIDILTMAQDEGREDALSEIFKLVSTVEGDSSSFSEKNFPQMVVELILLVGEITQHAK